MARITPDSGDTELNERIDDIDVAAEMQGSFLEYAYSVIYSRALPDARDGLKPVQRRILFQMTEMGLRPDKGHVKSARVVGDVMGKLHPHGDGAIYDAIVRMAQPFTLRVPLVDGHGNFGSLDDGPAASRYTEVRLDASALALTAHLDEDVVDFVPNYDNQLMQPSVLPAAFPNLLVNGASGIAVGMATNMAPHNLIEVVAAAKFLLKNPEATVEQLMTFVPGPDLPGGGTIVGLDGIGDAYRTGRGAFKTRARVAIEAITARKSGLVVTELPYGVGPEKVIEKIKEGVNNKKLSGISDVNDLTDSRNGLKLIIGIKTGYSPEAVLQQLYRFTPLEDSFSINNVALVSGEPKTLGLRELLRVYVDHRIEVVTRRTQYRLDRKRERLHLVEGLLVAIVDIDEVIQVIRQSDDAESARARLIDIFELSEIQSEYILDLRLRRLTKFTRLELESERDTLTSDVAHLVSLLAERLKIQELIADELDEVSSRFGTPRRTLLTETATSTVARGSRDKSQPLEVVDTACTIYLSTTGRAIRVDQNISDRLHSWRDPQRATHDAVLSRIETSTRSTVGAVTNLGRIVTFTPVDLPSVPSSSIRLAAGTLLSDYLGNLKPGERVVGLTAPTEQKELTMGTRLGAIKRVTIGEWPNKESFEVITLRDSDEVIGVGHSGDDAELVFISTDAQLLKFSSSAVRAQGKSATGMAGIRLADGARGQSFSVVDAERRTEAVVVTVAASSNVLTGTDPGSSKMTALAEYPAKGRGTGGVRCQRLLKGEDGVILSWVGLPPVRALDIDGNPRSLPETLSKRDASGILLDATVHSIGFAIS